MDLKAEGTDREDYYSLSGRQRLYVRVKDVLDRLAGVGGMIIASPVFIVTALLIKKEEGLRAPVFFKQKRVGKNKELFDLYNVSGIPRYELPPLPGVA